MPADDARVACGIMHLQSSARIVGILSIPKATRVHIHHRLSLPLWWLSILSILPSIAACRPLFYINSPDSSLVPRGPSSPSQVKEALNTSLAVKQSPTKVARDQRPDQQGASPFRLQIRRCMGIQPRLSPKWFGGIWARSLCGRGAFRDRSLFW